MKRRLIVIILLIVVIVIGITTLQHREHSTDFSQKFDSLVVEKSKRTLLAYNNGVLIKTYKISLGRVPKGKKEFEGDRKTPEGLYFINDKNPNSGYHKNLGISYPNDSDKINAAAHNKEPGGLVKIHGMKNGFGWLGKSHLLIDWTLGCIAVDNQTIDELFYAVELGTPIEIKK